MSWSSFAFLALSKVTAQPPPAAEGITLSRDGFLYQPARGIAVAVRWEELKRVTAYCVALFSHEAICFDFEVGDLRISVNEELPGFEALREALPAALGLSPDAARDPVPGELKVLFERR